MKFRQPVIIVTRLAPHGVENGPPPPRPSAAPNHLNLKRPKQETSSLKQTPTIARGAAHQACPSKQSRSAKRSTTLSSPSAGARARSSIRKSCALTMQPTREQTMANQALIRPVTAPAPQQPMRAAGIPTRGVASPRLKYGGSVSTYANHTVASSTKASKTGADSSRTTTAVSTPRPHSRTSQSSHELYALAHDFCAGTAASNAKAVSNQELQAN